MKPLRLEDRYARVASLDCDDALRVDKVNWGRSVIVNSESPKTLIQWEVGYLGAEFVTVALSLDSLEFVDDIGTAPVVADLSWGVGGGHHTATVDVSNGTMIALVASFVRVDCRMLAVTPVEGVTVRAEQARVFGSLAFGVQPGASQPTLTLAASVIESEGPALDIVIPPFAKGFTLYSPDPFFFEEGNATVQIVNSFGAPEVVQQLDGSELFCSQQSCCGYPLPGHARSILVGTALESVRVTPMFFLHL